MRPANAASLCLGSLLLAACGKEAPPPPPPPCAFADGLGCPSAARLEADVAYLASPALAGRRVGSPGNDLAARHVEAAFTGAGLAFPAGATSHRHPFDLATWNWTAPPVLELAGSTKVLGTDYEPLEWAASGDVSGTLAFVGYGLTLPAFDPAAWPSCPLPSGWDDLAGVDLTGRVAVVVSGAPGGATQLTSVCPVRADCSGPGKHGCYNSADKAALAAGRGAAAVVFVPRSAAAPQPVPNAWVLSPVPALWARYAAVAAALPGLAAWISQVDGLTPSPQLTAVPARVASSGSSVAGVPFNVIGVVPGADPVLRDEVVIVGGHFDHLGQLPFRSAYFPGADDNASGTAVVMELARLLAARPAPPARTVVFAAWNAEELGMVGSYAWVHGPPPYPLASTVAVLSVDMVGVGQAGLELSLAQEPGTAVITAAQASAASLGLTEPITASPEVVWGSDHAYFSLEGVPALYVATPTFALHTTYHTVDDTAATVHGDLLATVTRLTWATIRPWVLGTEASYLGATPLTPLPSGAPGTPRPGPGPARLTLDPLEAPLR